MSDRIEVNGVQLYYELTGDSGEPLVFVHGSWVDHHKWDGIAPALAQSFRVLTYDRRGHSQSERPSGQGSIREDVADLAALIEALDLAPAHIFGSSFGGSIALRLAGERPDLVSSLIVNEPPLVSLLAEMPDGATMLQAIEARFAEIRRLLEAGDMEGGARQFVEAVAFGPGAWPHVPPQLKQTVIFNAPTFLDELRDPEMYAFDLAELRNFDKPVLLTVGEHGVPFMPPIVDKVANALPRAETMVFPGADHQVEQHDPQLFVATIKEFTTREVSH